MRIQILNLGSKGLKQDFFIKALHLFFSGFLELEIGYYMYTLHGSRGGGVLWISSNGDDRFRDFFGYENLASIFLGSLIWVGIFGGY